MSDEKAAKGEAAKVPAGVGLRPSAQQAQQAQQSSSNPQQAQGGAAQPLQSPPPANFVTQVSGGSSIVRIAAGGEPREIWSNDQAVVYALALDAEGRTTPEFASNEVEVHNSRY